MWAHVRACTWDTRGKYRHMRAHTHMWSHTQGENTCAHTRLTQAHTWGTRTRAHRGHKTGHMGCSVNETCAKRTAWPLQAEAFSLWVLQAEGKGETAAPRAHEPVFMGSSPGSWLREPSCTSPLKEGLCSHGGGGLPLPNWAPRGSASMLTTTQMAGHSGRHPVVPSAESLGPWAAHSQGQPWAGSWSGAALGRLTAQGCTGRDRSSQLQGSPSLPLTVGHTHPDHPGTLEKPGDKSEVWPSAPQHPAPHPASYSHWLCSSSASAWPSTGWAARAISGEALGVAGSRVGGGGQNLQN